MAIYLNERGIDPGPHLEYGAHPDRARDQLPPALQEKPYDLISVVMLSLCDPCAIELDLRPGGVVFEPGRVPECIDIMKSRGLIVDG